MKNAIFTRQKNRSKRRKRSMKYRSKRTVVDGITFDSKKEANRYCELKLLEKSGEIKNLELQKKFVLIPAVIILSWAMTNFLSSIIQIFLFTNIDIKK